LRRRRRAGDDYRLPREWRALQDIPDGTALWLFLAVLLVVCGLVVIVLRGPSGRCLIDSELADPARLGLTQ